MPTHSNDLSHQQRQKDVRHRERLRWKGFQLSSDRSLPNENGFHLHRQQNYWKQLCEEHHFTIKHRVADGGESRFHSVKNGLSLIETPSIVGVHDGVRPFVSVDVIDRCYELALTKEAVVPVVDVVDTVRHITKNGSETVDRSAYKLVQTPQVFNADLLLKGYEQPYSSAFTDDASVVEAMGVKVALTPGNRENIKLTTPFDLKVAEALL
jgi:2-C-methyl-D-erythritol 4-phosphate cytidylyltransferase